MLKNNDKILLLIGIVGALLFFWGYPEQNPQSAIKLPLKSEQIVHKTRRYLHISGILYWWPVTLPDHRWNSFWSTVH